MADRLHMAPRNTQASASALGRTKLAAGVRRNLFQNQLTRRPTASSISSGDSSSTARGIEFEPASDVSIVARDKKGDIEVFDPLSLIGDDGGALDDREESKRERERLADMVRQMAVARGPGQDDEFLDALKTSLRAKVCALDEDNWMFEAEEAPRIQ
ncbi:hypothetical protein MKZ38_008346 [Zalerion maritima]|uniref:Uncharacterized protein n=1 Tax=Zalerion maritima TaxID=339359 RepID=A0AAD5RU61_9PEZI|nr:hypothetical protein MKZ38_008346 [Zalerion maritima]